MGFIVVNGRWVHTNGEPINPVDLNKLPAHMGKITKFASGKTLTFSKIEVLSKILDADSIHEQAIIKILGMSKEDVAKIV